MDFKKIRLLIGLLLLLVTYSATMAHQSPQFLMPLYFEDGNGDRDTLYIGYDSLANTNQGECLGPMDTIFGEKWVQIDTTQFNAFLYAYPCYPGTGYSGSVAIQTDSVTKTDIQSVKSYHLELNMLIGFTKGTLPLTLKWDKEMFYHEGLPFSNNPPAPRARGQISCLGSFPCAVEYDKLVLTDYPDNRFGEIYTDSIVFTPRYDYPEGTPLRKMLFSFEFDIVPYNSEVYMDIQESYEPDLEVYPNPFRDEINLQMNEGSMATYRIYSVYGALKQKGKLNSNITSISTEKLRSGIYTLVIHTGRSTFNKLIVKH